MTPTTPLSGLGPAAAATDESIWAEVDSTGRLVVLSEGWDVLIDRHEAPALASERWLGRSLEALLGPEDWAAWRDVLAAFCAARPDAPPDLDVRDHPVLRGLVGWPIFEDGRVDRLRLWPSVDLDPLFARPMLCVPAGEAPRGVNRAGRALIDAASVDDMTLDDWLAWMQPPRRLEPLAGLRLDAGPLVWARPSEAWDNPWAAIVMRTVRSGLHDLSNPLAGARMLAEVLRLGDPEGKTGGIVEHLDATHASLQRLRGVLAADPRQEIDLATAFSQAVEVLASELARREVEVDIAALPEHELRRSEVFAVPFGLALVMAVAVRCAPGDRVVLALVPCLDGGWRLEAHVAGLDPPLGVPDPAIDPALLHAVAADVGGRLVIAPASRPQRDPEWAVEWPDQSRSRYV